MGPKNVTLPASQIEHIEKNTLHLTDIGTHMDERRGGTKEEWFDHALLGLLAPAAFAPGVFLTDA
jgi:hypothetical protein